MVACWTEQYSGVIKPPRTHILIFSFSVTPSPEKPQLLLFMSFCSPQWKGKAGQKFLLSYFVVIYVTAAQEAQAHRGDPGSHSPAANIPKGALRCSNEMCVCSCLSTPAEPKPPPPHHLPCPFLRFLCSHLTQQPMPSHHLNTKFIAASLSAPPGPHISSSLTQPKAVGK